MGILARVMALFNGEAQAQRRRTGADREEIDVDDFTDGQRP